MAFIDFPQTFNIVPLQRRPYKYSLRNSDGSFYANLTHVFNSTLKLKINKPSELSFSIPYDSEVASMLVGKAEIFLHDKNDQIIGQFQIHKRKDMNDEIAIIKIIAYDALARLTKDTTSDYDTSGAKTVTLIIDDLLALQSDDNPISKGTIDTGIAETTKTVVVSSETSLLSVLKNIEKTFSTPNHFYVDENRLFHWRELGNFSGFNARIGKNIKTIEREFDYDKTPSRVYSKDDTSTTTGWLRSQRIVVNEKKVGVDLGEVGITNFPVKVSLKSSDLATMAQSGGEDVFFTLDGVKLTHEVSSYNNSTGEIIAYVEVPNLSSVNPTQLRMFYGNSGASDQGGSVDINPSGKTQPWQNTFSEMNSSYDDFTTISSGSEIEDNPLVSYSLTLSDLYEIAGDQYERIILGDQIWIQDDILKIGTMQTVTALTKNLDKPWEVRITLLNEPRDIVDEISETIEDVSRIDDELQDVLTDIIQNTDDIATNSVDVSNNADAITAIEAGTSVIVLFGQVTADTSGGGRKKYSVDLYTNPDKDNMAQNITDVYIADDSYTFVSVNDWVYIMFSPDTEIWGHTLIPMGGGSGTTTYFPTQFFGVYSGGVKGVYDGT